ncbi:MAG: hypothetical protein A2W31_16470 [Planctomycetes bacterium RBG_16_64_10]|nr:MAG: hypothetical protein A2W31_16470 [Planctomycetes bacterium RBG_16_64_10]
MKAARLLLALTITVGWPAVHPTAGGETLEDPTLTGCVVTAKSDVVVSAEDAGVLVAVDVTEGDQVRQGYPLARIDDTEPQIRKQLAEFEQNAAEEEASNDISVRYSRAQADHAQSTVEEKVAANRRVPGTVTNEELRTVELDWKRTKLSIEQAIFEMKLAGITAKGKAASVAMEEKNIERRQIKARIDGTVVELDKRAGEWVSPGDPILRIIDVSTLRIEGFLNASQYDPHDVSGRPVTVEVELARGRQLKLTGQVTFVSPEVLTGGEYPVRAEVKNRTEGDQWVLRPGLIASMVIHVNRAIEGGKSPAASNGKARAPVSTSKSSRAQASAR